MGDGRLVTRSGGGYVLHLGKEERALLARLLDELRELLTDPQETELLGRLFPVVHPDHPEQEAEYQRLMRDELVTSRLAGIDTVSQLLAKHGRKVSLDDAQMTSLVQAVNGVRLVLGTMLDVTEDDDMGQPALAESPEYHLYAYLSWILDAAVQAMSGALPIPRDP